MNTDYINDYAVDKYLNSMIEIEVKYTVFLADRDEERTEKLEVPIHYSEEDVYNAVWNFEGNQDFELNEWK